MCPPQACTGPVMQRCRRPAMQQQHASNTACPSSQAVTDQRRHTATRNCLQDSRGEERAHLIVSVAQHLLAPRHAAGGHGARWGRQCKRLLPILQLRWRLCRLRGSPLLLRLHAAQLLRLLFPCLHIRLLSTRVSLAGCPRCCRRRSRAGGTAVAARVWQSRGPAARRRDRHCCVRPECGAVRATEPNWVGGRCKVARDGAGAPGLLVPLRTPAGTARHVLIITFPRAAAGF